MRHQRKMIREKDNKVSNSGTITATEILKMTKKNTQYGLNAMALS